MTELLEPGQLRADEIAWCAEDHVADVRATHLLNNLPLCAEHLADYEGPPRAMRALVPWAAARGLEDELRP